MGNPISFGKFDVNAVASLGDSSAAPEPDAPFRVAVLGDFSGRGSRGLCQPESLAGRRLHLIDRDNFEELLGKLGVEVHLPMAGGQALQLRFRELDDFHPDRIYEQVEAFAALRQLRRKLLSPQTFTEAAAEVRGWREALVAAKPAPEPTPPPSRTGWQPVPRSPQPVPEGLFDQILAEAEQQSSESAARPAPSQWDLLIADLIDPYLEPKADPQQAEYVASVDAAVGELMRKILHHPQFQALEASWRELSLLVSRLECGTDLKLFVWDVSKAELAAELSAVEDLARSGIYRVLVERSVHVLEGQPWALFVGDYCFGPTRADAELLGRLAKIARAAGAPWIAGADARLAGCESLVRTPDPDDWQFVPDKEASQVWAALRMLPESPWVGLALPRFLLRLPYGRQAAPVEKFEFEELPGEPDHEGYLWGNSAFACACLLGQSFTQHGWGFRPGMIDQLDDLPIHVYKSEGESEMKPCAEVLLTDRAAQAISDRGLIPLRSVRNQGAVRVESFRSFAGSGASLRGRWSH
jgi:type VI secretion system protein ImpC